MSEVMRGEGLDSKFQGRPSQEDILARVQIIQGRGAEGFSLMNEISAIAEGEDISEALAQAYPGWTREDFQQLDEELEKIELD